MVGRAQFSKLFQLKMVSSSSLAAWAFVCYWKSVRICMSSKYGYRCLYRTYIPIETAHSNIPQFKSIKILKLYHNTNWFAFGLQCT